ncbi:MAG TPA: HNH endonuclease [Tepidisphaeraceae bacterium]|nr:HNH endonuclease [Tepidisphaeraceae bacterium]
MTVSDLRALMGAAEDGWGRASKTSRFRFNIEADEDREINTDWFSREVIHGAVTSEKWSTLPPGVREGLNRAILRYDPDHEDDAVKLRAGIMKWARLTDAQADALVAAWRRRPRPDAKRLNMSRGAVRNLLALMDRPDPWPDSSRPDLPRWLTQNEARKLIAADASFRDATTGKPLDERTRRRYATGARGATARDRHYTRKHLLTKNGASIFGPDGLPLGEPPPAPLISNPVVRKAIHEVRRHLVEYMKTFGRKPDQVYVELSREAKMGKKDADEALFRNRLRNRIRRDIAAAFDLDARTSTQQRAAVDRVILCVQQDGVCPLCGNQRVQTAITPRAAAEGEGCEVAHIIPKACGGHSGLGNLVLAHTKCNRDMARRTPRKFWQDTLESGFEEGMRWIDGIFGDIKRPKPWEVTQATGPALWSCYFTGKPGRRGPTFDELKIRQFAKEVRDIQQMTERQDAATKYATRQVMAYLADALYEGAGLPERGGERRIFATDGIWTARLRREWRLSFDPHQARGKGLCADEERLRYEKNRGDHRHHAIDAVVIALSSEQVRKQWDEREMRADNDGVNTADEVAIANYRRLHPLPVPPPFGSREALHDAARRAVFGERELERPVCHRPAKRKLIGELHEAFPRGPVLDSCGALTDRFTKRINVRELTSKHLREPREETEGEAIARLAARRLQAEPMDERTARKWARSVVSSRGYKPTMVDPPPEKSGIVRDVATRLRLRQCLQDGGLDPDHFSASQLKKLVESGGLRQLSGVPIRSVVLLWTIKDPAIVSRWASDHATGKRHKVFDARTGHGRPAAARAYIGGNQHHVEIRRDARATLSAAMVSAFEAARRKLQRLRAIRDAGVPAGTAMRKHSKAERIQFTRVVRDLEAAHPIVDRSDSDALGGSFVMSLCEGETLLMRHKHTGDIGYFIVAKLNKPQTVVVVPHWDARAAGERKDSEGKKVPDSERQQFGLTPADLEKLAPPGREHAVKVRVSPLGFVTELRRD